MSGREWPTCPACGELAQSAEVAMMKVVGRALLPTEVKPHPAGATYACANGHSFRNGVLADVPEDIVVRWYP